MQTSNHFHPMTWLGALIATLGLAAGCGSGGSGGGAAAVPVDVSVSDAAVGDLAAVVVTLERVVVNRPGQDIVVETFPAEDPEDPPTERITFDLLDYQGMDRLLIIDGLMLVPGSYQNMRLEVVESESFVEEADGDIRELKVPSGELKLGGFDVPAGGPQAFVIEFPLMHAMTYNPGPQRYILKPRGVRIVDIARAATLGGTVDSDLFDLGLDCDLKPEPDEGNAVYLYQGHGLDLEALGDLFDPALDPDAADDFEPAYSAVPVDDDGTYFFSFLPPGDYTVAFACDAAGDDPEFDDGILVPNPFEEWAEISVGTTDDVVCDFPIATGGCF